jgi:hypothetical protein
MTERTFHKVQLYPGNDLMFHVGTPIDTERGVVFPTPVGMNRNSARTFRRRPRVPHARGDEPFTTEGEG